MIQRVQPLAPLIALLSTIQSLKPEGNDGVSDLPINRYQLVKNMRTRAPSYMEDDSGTVDSLITLKAIDEVCHYQSYNSVQRSSPEKGYSQLRVLEFDNVVTICEKTPKKEKAKICDKVSQQSCRTVKVFIGGYVSLIM